MWATRPRSTGRGRPAAAGAARPDSARIRCSASPARTRPVPSHPGPSTASRRTRSPPPPARPAPGRGRGRSRGMRGRRSRSRRGMCSGYLGRLGSCTPPRHSTTREPPRRSSRRCAGCRRCPAPRPRLSERNHNRMRAVAATYTHARRIKRLEAVVVCGNGVSRELHSDHEKPKFGRGC